MDNEFLYQEIVHLISLKLEGEYWDFKKEWYHNKTDLLHDIICMANNLSNHDAYIIIGIDEESSYMASDVSNDPNRKSTENITTFLREKKFAGGVRPVVLVISIDYQSSIIDVIVVKNSHHTPFFLSENFEGVFANNIYTRIMDSNTPINKSADVNCIESLWKKRFYIDEPPTSRLNYYLSNINDWNESPIIDTNEIKYYKYAPEFTICEESDDTRNGYELYLFCQIDMRPHWYNIEIKYHQTTIEYFSGVALDGARCFVVCPEINGLAFNEHHNWDISYYFFVKGTLRYNLLALYCHLRSDQYQLKQFMQCILVFDSNDEHAKFREFVMSNKEDYYNELNKISENQLPFFPALEGYNIEEFKEQYKSAVSLKSLLKQYKDHSNQT